MKSTLKLFCLTILIAITMIACQSSKTEDSTSETNDAPVTDATAEAISTQALINPNLASESELSDLDEISATLATQIIEQRPFLSMTDLDALLSETMDAAERETLYSKMFVPFNLNTTPEDEFKIIPGVGDRMAHEFEEYRPYVKIEQFRKEIGKYVDEDEVARLEQYIFVPVELNTASKEEILAIPGVGERMLHEFEEYRPYKNMEQFRREIGKYVDDKELSRLERFVYLSE